MILFLDNYDSFTYNVAHHFGRLGFEVKVVRSDAVVPDQVEAWWPRAIVISPGPGRPEDAGVLAEHLFHQELLLIGCQVLERRWLRSTAVPPEAAQDRTAQGQ